VAEKCHRLLLIGGIVLNRLFTPIIIILAVLFFFSPSNCICAEKTISDKITSTLVPLKATVIKSQDGRYLLNIGADNHIRKGDLWTLYSKGEQIIDPVTGKILGTLPVLLAVCNVIQVEKYFSEIAIKCLNKPCDIQSGLTAHRFQDIKTTFQDMNGTSFHLYELIRARLPSLDWQAYQRIEKNTRPIPSPDEIVIVADKQNFTIWSGGEILAAYKKSTSALSISPTSTHKSEQPETGGKENQTVPKNIPGLSGRTPGLSTLLEINDYSAVARLDHSVTDMGIMVPDNSESPYLIYLYNKTVIAQAMDDTEKYQYNYQGFGDVLNISPGHNGLIILNIYDQKEGMRSKILKLSSHGFTVLSKEVDHFMAFLDTDGTGIRESFVGQNYDAETCFDDAVFTLEIDDAGRITQHGTINMPDKFNLPGAIFADLDGNGIQESVFYNAGGQLVIYESDKQKWESPAPFVPVKSILVDDMITETDAPTDLPLWPQPALFQFDNLIFTIIPANDSGFWRTISGSPLNGRLGILCPHNGIYSFKLLSTPFQGPVQSVCVYNNMLYIAVVEGNTFTGKGITHVLAVPIKDLKQSLK